VSSGQAQPGRPTSPAAPDPSPDPGAPAAGRTATKAGREVFRLAPPIVFWWVWVAFAVADVVDFAVQGASARLAVVVTAILVTVTGLAYVLALRPKVVSDETGITVVNPVRDHHVPWKAVQTVDTGDWVRIHHAPADGAPSSAAGKVIYCWALYVSARSKRRSSRVPIQQPRRGGFLRPQLPPGIGEEPQYAGNSRLPEEAKYLASLPPPKAIALRLDTRAAKERARWADADPAQVSARWVWTAIAAVVVPALALLIVALV
jgi:Bacterial PH domain